jgi:hypothetical protein
MCDQAFVKQATIDRIILIGFSCEERYQSAGEILKTIGAIVKVKRLEFLNLSLGLGLGVVAWSIEPKFISFKNHTKIAQSAIAEAKTKPLPESVKQAVFTDVSESMSSTPISELKIVEAKPQDWSNGCLGLAQVDEICTQVIVSGWYVVVSDGKSTWTYRTDSSGREIRLEKLSL